MASMMSGVGRGVAWAAAVGLMGVLATQSVGCDIRTDVKATETVTVSISDPASRIALRNMVGDVTITADSAATSVTAEAKKVGKGPDDAGAQEALKEISVSVGPSPDEPGVLLLSAKHPGGKPGRGYEVEWTVTAPPAMVIDLKNNVGEVKVTGFRAGATVTCNVGDLTLQDIAGGVNVDGNVGDLTATGIDGAVTAATSTGDITVNSTGAVSAQTSTGRVRVSAMGKQPASVTATTSTGDVSVTVPASWAGRVKASTSVGDLLVQLEKLDAGADKGRKSFRGTVGGGGEATIEASSSVGDVKVSNGT